MNGLFAQIGTNMQLQTSSQASEVIEIHCPMADLHGSPLKQWNVRDSEALYRFSNIATIPDTHDMKNTIEKPKSIRFCSNHTTLATRRFEPAKLCTAEYVTMQNKVIDNRPGHLSDHSIKWIKAMEDVQLQLIDTGLSESLDQAEKFVKICDLNQSLVSKVKDLEAAEPVQGPNKEVAAAYQEKDELKGVLQIKKLC
jgi:hypothetical protein